MPHKKLKRGQLAKGSRVPAAGSPPLYFTTKGGFLQGFCRPRPPVLQAKKVKGPHTTGKLLKNLSLAIKLQKAALR
jgi:hypothetical protein